MKRAGEFGILKAMPDQRNSSNFIFIIGGIVVLGLLIGGYFAWQSLSATPPAEEPVVETPVVADTTTTYASSTLGLTVKYPKDYLLNESFTNTTVNPQKPISGVKFTVPLTMATGTNLSADSGVSIEWLPRAKSCTGDIYLAANVKPTTLADGSATYSVATSSDAGAGNLYEEIVYAIPSSTPCMAVRYFIHSTQIANYPAGTVRAFDRAALISDFDKIRRSLVLTPAASQ